jgi:hypothetical protein
MAQDNGSETMAQGQAQIDDNYDNYYLFAKIFDMFSFNFSLLIMQHVSNK